MPYGSICCTHHQLKYSYLNRSKHLPQNKSHTKKRAYLSDKRRFRDKGRSREWAKKQKQIRQKEQQDHRQKNKKRRYNKVGSKLKALRFQTGDGGGGDIRNPRPPFRGGRKNERGDIEKWDEN